MQNGVIETIFFGNLQDDGKGCGVFTVLNSAIDILTVGIGILAVIGITIVGIKYLTAKGNVEQTAKAKRRMLEIIIGLVAYVLLYAGVQFLLPGGHLSNNQGCATISDQELADLKEQQKQEKVNAQESESDQKVDGSKEQEKTNPKESEKTLTNAAKRKKISDVGVALAWSSSKQPFKERATTAFNTAMNQIKSNKGEKGCRAKGQSCGMFVGTVVRYSGVDKNIPTMASRIYNYFLGRGKYKGKGGNKKWKELKNKADAKPGDIALKIKNGQATHVAMYVKNKQGKTVTAEGSLCNYYGVIKSEKKFINRSDYKIYRYVGD